MSNQLIPKNTMQTILQNANSLWTDNYRVELIMGDGLFRVFNLNKDSSYTVEGRGEKSCECICFQRNGTCKHVQGLVILIQRQITSYQTRKQEILQALKRNRGTADYLAGQTARVTLLDIAAWELECALSDLTGTGEFYMPRKLVGFIPEVGQTVRGEDRRAA